MSEKPRKIAVIDCETDPFGWNTNDFEDNEVHPFCWGFYCLESSTYHEFWNDDLSVYGCYSATRKLVDFLLDENYLIYAHNGGKFDFLFLLPWFDPEIVLVNGRIAKASIGQNEFRDSFMILPVPLSAMEKEADFDYAEKMHFQRRKHYREEISRYLKSDCVNLAKWVRAFIEKYGIKFTLAGTALSEIKKSGYEVVNTFEEYDDSIRPYYFGGRTQCFEKGEFEGQLEYFDINSAYPYAMLFAHPQGTSRTEFKNMLPRGENSVYFVTIRAISKGCLPIRKSCKCKWCLASRPDDYDSTGDEKLEYPTDNEPRIYHATGWEVRAGLDTGTLEILEVLHGYRYIAIADFSKFIKDYYEQKSNSEKGSSEYLFAKLIMNSGYGKFGQDVRTYKNYCLTQLNKHPMQDTPIPVDPIDRAEYEAEFKSWKPYGDHFEYSVWEQPDPGFRFYNVATAASITGFVRAYLWRHICASEGVLYCDTDSIVCKRFAGVEGEELGQWGKECVVERAFIAQRKMYCLKVEGGVWKSKVKNNTVTLSYEPIYKTASKGVRLSPQEIIDGVRFGGEVTFEKESPAFSVKYGQRFMRKTIDFDV